MPRITVVLDDPRLAPVREREQAHDWSTAARLLDATRATVALDAERTGAWAYVAGRLHLTAGEASDAVSAFGQVCSPGSGCALAPYVALREAQAFVRLGRFDDAIACARSVGDDVAAHDETQLAIADGCVGKGDRACAVPIWRALLCASPHGLRWADTSVQLATALHDAVDGVPETHAQEAFDLATRVLVEAPAVAEKIDLNALRAKASSMLIPRPALLLAPEELVRQAQAWLDGGKSKRAIEIADALLKALPRGRGEHHETGCKAAIIRAQAKPRGKAEDLADVWGSAIARCEGDDALVTALYSGGKASASAHRTSQALERFGRVEKIFPKHRLADDACFRAALVACDDGDEPRGLAMLSSLPDSYPEGDMGGEALFRVSVAKLAKQDLDGARDALDRILAAGLDGTRNAGRAAYFRARVAHLSGDVDDAKKRYAAVFGEQPLGYYMLLSYARLRDISEEEARAAMEAGIASEQAGSFLTRAHPELASPAFRRFQRLLEVGEIDAARHEVHGAGFVAEGADPEVVWTVAWLYDLAGAPELGHSFSRTRLLDYREHWPAGRWRLAWETAFPRVWDTIVTRESDAARVPRPLTWGIMREESAFNPDAHSVADAIGLMQLIEPTARATARGTPFPSDEDALRRPEISIALGTRLLSSLRALFPSTPALAIAAYNGGARAVRRWLVEHASDDFDVFVERIPFEETRAYIKRVLASQAAYAFLYAPDTLGELLALPARRSSDNVALSP